MSRSNFSVAFGCATVLAFASACSGPTNPTTSSSTKTAPNTTTAPPSTPTPATPKGTVGFVSAIPAPGADVTISASAPSQASSMVVSFSAHFDTDLPDVLMQAQLLDANGRICASGTSPTMNLAANADVTLTATGFSLACALPVTTASIQAALVPSSGGSAYGQTSIPAQYTFKLAPTPPPTITALTYYDYVPVGHLDPPLPNDNINVGCSVAETDGLPITITLTVAFDGPAPMQWTSTTPAGASSSAAGASFNVSLTAPPTLKAPPGGLHFKLSCDGTNDRGQTASKSTDIGVPPK